MTTPDLIAAVKAIFIDYACSPTMSADEASSAAIRAVLLAQIAGAEKQPNYLWVAAWLRDFANLHQIPLTDGGE